MTKPHKTIISLFDGMSCGQKAFSNLNIPIKDYYASEIDKYAMSVTRYNFPDTKFIGSVTDITIEKLDNDHILLNSTHKICTDNLILIGGSPCQGFSFAGKRKGATTKCNIEITTLEQYLTLKSQNFEFQGQSYLFWEYIRILRTLQSINPNITFFLENVKMIKKWQSMFDVAVGIKPVEINSSLVSAQNRKRLYWTNINNGKIEQPEDRGILLRDIIQYEILDEKLYLKENNIEFMSKKYGNESRWQKFPNYINKKAGTVCVTSCKGLSRGVIILNESLQRDFYKNPLKSQDLINDYTNLIINKNITLKPQKTTNSLCNHVANIDMKGNDSIKRVYVTNGKSLTLTTMQGGHRQPKILCNFQNLVARKLSPIECERLQTLPDNYTAFGLDENFKKIKISNTQRYKMIGSEWTIAIIEHIFIY